MKNNNKYIKIRIANYGHKVGNKIFEDFPYIPSGHRNIFIWIPNKSKYVYYRETLETPRHKMFKSKFEDLGYNLLDK